MKKGIICIIIMGSCYASPSSNENYLINSDSKNSRIEMSIEEGEYISSGFKFYKRIKVTNVSPDTIITWIADKDIQGKSERVLLKEHFFYKEGDLSLSLITGELAGEFNLSKMIIPAFLIKRLAPKESFTYVFLSKSTKKKQYEKRIVSMAEKHLTQYLMYRANKGICYQYPEIVILDE